MRVSRVSASLQPWNSATTLYIARKIQELAAGRALSVLDMGCGEGRVLEQLLSLGHRLHGFDLPDKREALRRNLGPVFGDLFDARVRVMDDERCIPFPDAAFDVVYANQVFEHVRFLDPMLAECARVLKPGGTLIALFPLATCIVEGHVLVPFAHWVPPGTVRQRYLAAFLALSSRRRFPGRSVFGSAVEWDDRLRHFTFYRFINEITAVFEHYFETSHVDADGYVQAKVDLLKARGGARRRLGARLLRVLQGPRLSAFVTHGFMGVFCATGPTDITARHRVVPWRHE